MEFSEYMVAFEKIIKEKQPIREKRTVEDYLFAFAELPPLLRETKKCATGSSLLREIGNMKFETGDYEEAAIQYTYSISKAPPYSECSALGYANRSAALLHLGSFEECISDIDRALDLPYPESLKAKLISRKKDALKILRSVKSKKKNEKKEKNDHPLIANNLKRDNGENAKLPDASCGIDVVCAAGNGTKLVANVEFNAGDVLVVEKPFLAVAAIEEDPTSCHHCLKKTFCLIPCDACTYEVYCSQKCRTEAYDNYHKTECRIQYTFIASYLSLSSDYRHLMVTFLRCLNILTAQGTQLNDLYRDFEEIEKTPDAVKLEFTRERCTKNTRKAYLASSIGKSAIFDDLMFEQTYVVVLLKNYTNFFQTNGDVEKLAKLMDKLMIPISFAIKHAKSIALYPLIGVAGHACPNNTIAHHDEEGRIILRASELITPGDQISVGYLPWQAHYLGERGKPNTIFRAKVKCIKCRSTFVYIFQRRTPVKLDRQLCKKLRQNLYDIKCWWKLLSIVQENDDDPASFSVQVIKMMLAGAYDGYIDPMEAVPRFEMLGLKLHLNILLLLK